MQYTIRRAAVTDANGIAAVARSTWNATYAHSISVANRQNFLNRAYAPAALKVVIEREAGWFYVASFQTQVVGYAQYVARHDSQWELVRLYVHPDHQRQGLGRGFLQAGAESIEGAGAEYCYAAMEHGNHSAHAFYKRFGFHHHREYARFLGDQIVQLVELRASISELLGALEGHFPRH